MSGTQAAAPADVFSQIRRVLWITMGLNVVATMAKLSVGVLTGSLSLIADGLDSVFDAASNVVGLVGVGIAAHPPDVRHPYGHRKAETITALVIAMLLFVTTWELAKSAVERLRNPELIRGEVRALSFVALGVSIAVHLLVVWYELRAGRRLRSDVLVADAMHTRADIFVSLSVVAGLIAVRVGYPLADPIVALVVAVFIGKIGVDIVREGLGPLMDEAALPVPELEQAILSVPGVLSSHRVRTRGVEGAMIADLHIRVNPAMGADESHAIAHEVERRLAEQNPALQDITIHVEPAYEIPAELTQRDIALRLRRMADGLGLGVHSVWAHRIDDAYHVDAHLEADGALPLREAHRLASALEERACSEIPEVAEVVTHLEPRGLLAPRHGAQAVGDGTLARIRDLADARLGPGTCHSIRIREGVDGSVVSMHCSLPGETTLAEAHRAGERLEREIHAALPGVERVVVHMEPEDEPEE